MKLLKSLRALLPAIICILMLAACGAPAKTTDTNGNVQDIQPGDQSIIQPPAQNSGQGSTLEERAL